MPADTSPRKPKIALLGTFGTGNLGNECTLDAVLYAFPAMIPSADIICICSGPEETKRKHRLCAFPIRPSLSFRRLFNSCFAPRTAPAGTQPSEITDPLPRTPPALQPVIRVLKLLFLVFEEPFRWYQAFKALKGTSALMVIGLGMLGDFGIRPFGLHYDLLRWSLVAKLSGRSLFFVSVGVGPIHNRLSRLMVKTALRLGDYRSYRDVFSRQYLEAIGFKRRVDAVYPDLVFSLPYALLPDKRKPGDGRAVVGYGIMNYYSPTGMMENREGIYKTYLARSSAAIVGLLERGYKIRLLIGDVAYDNSVRRDLRELIEKRGWTCDGNTLIDEPASSVGQLLSQVSDTDIVVASRFHNILLGLMLSKPVVALSYHEKVLDLVNSVGLAQYCQDIEHIDVERLITQCTELLTERVASQRRVHIDEQVSGFRRALNEQYDRIAALLIGR